MLHSISESGLFGPFPQMLSDTIVLSSFRLHLTSRVFFPVEDKEESGHRAKTLTTLREFLRHIGNFPKPEGLEK